MCGMVLMASETLYGQGFQVIISEIMGDPSPVVALPSEEYVELTNVSNEEQDISGWILSNGRTTGRLPSGFLLAAGEVIVICDKRAESQFLVYGRVAGLSPFPSITNSGDTIVLYNSQEDPVHTVVYNPRLLGSEKDDGGWSLELVDTGSACRKSQNWKASLDPAGGSPGKKNSHAVQQQPFLPVEPVYAWCPDEHTVRVYFTDRLNHKHAIQPSLYRIESGLNQAALAESVELVEPLAEEIIIRLTKPLIGSQQYQIRIKSVAACNDPPGTETGEYILPAGLPDSAEAGLVINEILADPSPGGADYVEVFHRGSSPVQLQHWQFANRNANGGLTGIRPLITTPRVIYPGEFLVFTTNAGWLRNQFMVKNPSAIIELASLPSLPNESGKLVLLKNENAVADELHYSAGWHHEMLRSSENVALERIDPFGPTQESPNWHSAAMQAGYGTPGYANSQSVAVADRNRVFVKSEIFSPDGDGLLDLCTINYEFEQPGYLLTIRIFDRYGNQHHTLVNNAICATTGSFSWNGNNDKGVLLPNGLYILVADIWHLSGKTKRYPMTVTLGKKY